MENILNFESMPNPKILLIGTGGVGTIVAYGLVYNKKSNVSVVVRSDYNRVKNRGWEINSCDYGHLKNWKPDFIYPNVQSAINNGLVYDFVVITMKNLPDVINPIDVVKSAITPEITTIVLIQNGFDLGRPFIEEFPKNYCLSGVSHIGSHNHNGIIKQSHNDKCLISYFDNPNFTKQEQELKAKEFVYLYSNDRNTISYFPDVKWYRYRKLVYNATLNTVCALTNIDCGRLLLSGTLENVAIPAMHEVIKIAKADGVELPADIINSVIHSNDGDWFKPSMLVDVEKGNPIELEVILGNLLKVARELKIETPVLNLLYNLLKATQFKLKEGKGLLKVPKERPFTSKFYS